MLWALLFLLSLWIVDKFMLYFIHSLWKTLSTNTLNLNLFAEGCFFEQL